MSTVVPLPLPMATLRASGVRAAAWLLAALLTAAAQCVLGQAWEAGTDGLLPIPPLAAHVTDLTHSLAPAETAALESKLADWEARTSNQLAVLIVPTTQPEPIESYSLRVAEKWKIGRKGQDNGALFLVAKNDRKMRIEVGYGLEGVLTDVTARRIIAENVAPHFREGRYAAGIDAGVDRIIAVVGEGKPLPPRKAENVKRVAGGLDFNVVFVLLFVLVFAGRILRAIFGRMLGSTVGAGLVGAAAWFIAGSLAIAVVAAIIAFFVVAIFGNVADSLGRGGGWGPRGGGGWGGGGWSGGSGGLSGGGGFSGGGGSFGGGGASGNW